MRIIPMANGPRVALARILNISETELRSKTVCMIVLKDVIRAIDCAWDGGRPWSVLNPHEVATQLCLWSRSKMGSEVTPIAAIAEAMS